MVPMTIYIYIYALASCQLFAFLPNDSSSFAQALTRGFGVSTPRFTFRKNRSVHQFTVRICPNGFGVVRPSRVRLTSPYRSVRLHEILEVVIQKALMTYRSQSDQQTGLTFFFFNWTYGCVFAFLSLLINLPLVDVHSHSTL